MRRRSPDVWSGENTAEDGLPQIPYPFKDVIEALSPWVTPERFQRIQSVLEARLDSVTVVVDGLHDPHNGAAILRSADAFGVHTVHAIEWHESFAVSRGVSQGSHKWIRAFRHSTEDECIATLQTHNYTLCATHPQGDLQPADLAQLPRVALVLGNERSGISSQLRAACHHSVRIPMVGFVESLNVSVSAAILLYAATRHRKGDLSHEQRLEFLAQALWLSIARPNEYVQAWQERQRTIEQK